MQQDLKNIEYLLIDFMFKTIKLSAILAILSTNACKFDFGTKRLSRQRRRKGEGYRKGRGREKGRKEKGRGNS